MAAFNSNDSHDAVSPEGDDALWALLGKARRVEASPYFARRVLRAIETETETRAPWWRNLFQVAVPTAVCAGIAVMALVGVRSASTPSAVAKSDIEFETIQNLDLLVSNYESSLWLDQSLSQR